MSQIDPVAERRADDAWTAPKLIVLGTVTLTVALIVIWIIAKVSTPAGYN